MRGMSLILVALFIDGLQALLSAGFVALGGALTATTPVGGALGGAAAGAAICWNSAGGVISGIIDGAKCAAAGGVLGAGVSTFGIPLGIGLGFVSDVCISVTLGAGLMLLLAYNKMFYPTYAFGGGLGELIPGLDILPGWTIMTISCIVRKSREESGAQGGSILTPAFVFGAMVAAPEVALASRARTAVTSVAANNNRQAGSLVRETPQRVSPQLQSMRDVRTPSRAQTGRAPAANDNNPAAANDNLLKVYAAA